MEAKNSQIMISQNKMSKFQEFKKEEASVADDIFSEVQRGDELLDSN